jgi:hypothetical protein
MPKCRSFICYSSPNVPNNRITTALPHFPSNFFYFFFPLHKRRKSQEEISISGDPYK